MINVKKIHEASCKVGTAFNSAYKLLGKDHSVTVKLLEAYRELRRKIPGGKNELGYSTRYGATEAHNTTQG